MFQKPTPRDRRTDSVLKDRRRNLNVHVYENTTESGRKAKDT